MKIILIKVKTLCILSNILAGKAECAISVIPANERYIGRIAKPHNFK